MELINKATQKKSKYVKTLATYKHKLDDVEEDDGNAEESNKSKSEATSAKESNAKAGNWVARVRPIFFSEVVASYIETQQLKAQEHQKKPNNSKPRKIYLFEQFTNNSFSIIKLQRRKENVVYVNGGHVIAVVSI